MVFFFYARDWLVAAKSINDSQIFSG